MVKVGVVWCVGMVSAGQGINKVNSFSLRSDTCLLVAGWTIPYHASPCEMMQLNCPVPTLGYHLIRQYYLLKPELEDRSLGDSL